MDEVSETYSDEHKITGSISTHKLNFTSCLQCDASFSQRRIWFQSEFRKNFLNQQTHKNIIIPLAIKSIPVSIPRIRSTVVHVLTRNAILRTAVFIDEKTGKLQQEVRTAVNDNSYCFQKTNGIRSPDELKHLLSSEIESPFASIEDGIVLKCHVISLNFTDNDYLSPGDLIVFTVHPIAFDTYSIDLFYCSFVEAYETEECDTENFQYIDYTLYENVYSNEYISNLDGALARSFWFNLMHDYNLNGSDVLKKIFGKDNTERSSVHYSTTVTLPKYCVDAQKSVALFHDVSLFQLNLACFFIFLYKLANEATTDLCVTSLTNTRFLPELKSMIGPFVSPLPYRITIIPNESFSNFLVRIKQLSAAIDEHILFPYEPYSDVHNAVPMKQISIQFEYVTRNSLMVHEGSKSGQRRDVPFEFYSQTDDIYGSNTNANDFSFAIIHDDQTERVRLIFECSTTLCEQNGLDKIGVQFLNMFSRLVHCDPETVLSCLDLITIEEQSLPLSVTTANIQKDTFTRQSISFRTGMLKSRSIALFSL